MNLEINDLVVVYGILPPAKVTKIWFDHKTSRQVIELDWGLYGTSKVYGHDNNKIWYKYSSSN